MDFFFCRQNPFAEEILEGEFFLLLKIWNFLLRCVTCMVKLDLQAMFIGTRISIYQDLETTTKKRRFLLLFFSPHIFSHQ